ncbi:MAG TPA: DCC1-like thiol-disulfide oxidoreductase family protein [Blastocatellia bacterium]|jgi:predicted DCC family thiol-disulfide oxidoreductase YuxK
MRVRSDNQWTGGQYSVFRAIFGTYLFVHFAQLAPWGVEMFSNRGILPDGSASPLLRLFPNVLALYDAPAFVTALLVFAACASLLFAVGFYDRAAAIALWYTLACLFGRNPLISNPGLPYVGLLLLAHACLRRAPYGSFERRGQIDPGAEWRMPQEIYLVVWVLMALGYSYSGYTKMASPSWVDGTAVERVLNNPLARPGVMRDAFLALPQVILRAATWGALALELLFAPLALSRKLRPLLWTAMLSMHLGLIALIDFADLSLGMVMLHLFTFDPGWVKPLRKKAADMIFYDGRCGLCHRAVRFLLAEDSPGETFRFAPLGGEVFRATVTEGRRAALPDSLIVLTDEGELLSRSSAALYVMKRLGGMWRIIASIGKLIPGAWRDAGYDAVARMRYRLFRKPEFACPILPGPLRSRFEK